MNDLSLRVTALKLCAHPKRFAEMRSAPVRMPIKWQNSQEDYVQQFAAANTCNEQITVVKVIFGNAEAFAFLADLLFVCPLKHPVRGILNRLFSSNEVNKCNNATHTKDAMLRVLRDALQQLAEQIADSNINIDMLNDVLVSVGACLHSFAFGRDALAKEIHAFIPLLPRVLGRYWTSISEATVELSPTRRNEFYLFIQNLLRFYVNFMVDLKQFLVPQQCEPLRLISELAASVARHLDTPWDVRSIAGLAIGHNARFFNDFDEYMRSCHAINAFEELPIKAASLLVLQKTDYVERAVQALEILKSIIDQVNAAGDVTNLLVYMSKHLHTYSKSLSGIVLQDRPLVIYNLILVQLLKFALQHIGSSVESIRHMAASLLQQVLIHAKATGQTSIKQQVFAQLGREHIPLTSLCLIVQQLVEIMGTRDVLFHCPAVFQKIFVFYLGLDDNVNALYKSMMTVAHKEENFKDWYNIWVVTLLRQAQPYNERLAVIERLIKSTVELDGQVLGELCQYKNLTLSTKLAAMSTARRHGQQQAVKQLLGELSIQINQAMMGFNDNTRLMALAFVVETPRLSEPFTQFEIDAIMCFLHHNCNTPNAHVRQIARGLLQKGFKRLELNLAQQLKEKGGAEQLQQQPHTHMLSKFVNDLLTLLSLNLFPTANYGRRWISMQLIGDLLDMLERLRLREFYQLPAIALTYLEHCLRDSYEHNKLLAAGILAKLQPCIQLKPLDIMQHLVSQRPPDSVTGAYQLQVYCQAHQVAVELPEELLQHVSELPEVQPRYYLVLQWCLRELRAGIAMAEVDLTQAARHNPMYGLLFASRHLLQQLKLTELAEEALWRQYINELLEASMEVSELMLTVVASESPEGHVPTAETAEEEEEEAEEEEQQAEEEEQQVEDTEQAKAAAEAAAAAHTLTSQLVLLCAWRSIKEVSLITGELVHNAPLQQEQQQQKQPQHLLSQQQVAQIGEHFLLLLSEIKHRGAFEQAYVGFTLLCRRFWHSDEPALNQLPQQWLDEAMALVAGSEGAGGNKICPTRRSAGVPYMLQALICTELKLGTHNTFSRSMKLLLEVCERRESGSAASTARSHALNIMRALFRCSELSELVGEFIGRGVRCALESLVASEWAERNCATLLLSALIVRIFGVERARNEVGDLHLRNRMTGRIFFTRYPALFDYFHTVLGQAASRQFVQSTGGQTVQLEAMLQFLSRLYPSALEGIENTLNLNEFVPFLQRICCVHDYMTRVRASQVLANFTSIKTAKERIAHILMVLNLKHFKHKPDTTLYAKDLNALHGHLLQLLELYWIVHWKDTKLMSAMLHTVAQLALTVFDEDIYLFNAALNVLIAILQDASDGMAINDKLLALLQRIYALDHATVYERCNSYTISPKFFEVYGLHLHRITQNANVILEHMVRALIKPKEQQRPEMQQFAIDLFLHLLFDQANNVCSTRGIIESFELKNFQFDPDIVAYCKALGLKVRVGLNVLIGQLRQRRELIDFVLQLANDVVTERGHCPQLGSTVYTLLSLLGDELELPITELLERRNCDIEPGLVLCVTRQVMLENIRTLEGEEYQQFWLNILHYALDISDPKQKPYLRYKAAQLTDRIGIHIRQLFPTGNVQIVGNYVRLVLQLLVDESDLVRNCAAEMVASSCGESDQPVATFAMLPTTAEIYFLKHVLHSLKRFENDGTFLIGIFTTAVEPFVSAQFLDGRFHKDEPEEKISETMEDSEVFDKQDPNIYCEGLRVASVICNNFRVVFGQNKELICAFDALDKLTMCVGTNITPYIPQVST